MRWPRRYSTTTVASMAASRIACRSAMEPGDIWPGWYQPEAGAKVGGMEAKGREYLVLIDRDCSAIRQNRRSARGKNFRQN